MKRMNNTDKIDFTVETKPSHSRVSPTRLIVPVESSRDESQGKGRP